MNDSALIKQFCDQGQVSAFNTLVWRWQKPIFNFVLRFLGDPEQAREISQQTFIKAYRSLPNLKDHSRFSTWLYQIAVNLCRDEIKKRKRRKTFSLEGMQENAEQSGGRETLTMADESASPDSIVGRKELRDILAKALQQIPEEQRVVVIMKEYQGLKFVEIADTLGIPLNTAKSRMYYGLTALRKILTQWQFDQESFQYEM
jgi:RNA polymerase sigma-70 factor (ECF subfamily)